MSEKYDVILFLGQSNMQGMGEVLTEDEVVENAFEYKYLTDSLVELKNPVGEDISHGMTPGYNYADATDKGKWFEDLVLTAPCFYNTNMIPEFIRSYIGACGRKVIAVSANKGATSSDMWIPGSEGYDAIITKTKAAIKKIGKENVGHISCAWLQGESDALADVSAKKYEENVTALKDGMKKEFGLQKFGIIKVARFGFENSKSPEYLRRDEVIRDAQEELCQKDSDFVMLTRVADDMFYPFSPYKNNVHIGHYSSFGYEVLGRLSGKVLAKAFEK